MGSNGPLKKEKKGLEGCGEARTGSLKRLEILGA